MNDREKRFVTLALRHGVLNEGQVDACRVLQDEMVSMGDTKTPIWDFMLLAGVVGADKVKEILALVDSEGTSPAPAAAPPPPPPPPPRFEPPPRAAPPPPLEPVWPDLKPTAEAPKVEGRDRHLEIEYRDPAPEADDSAPTLLDIRIPQAAAPRPAGAKPVPPKPAPAPQPIPPSAPPKPAAAPTLNTFGPFELMGKLGEGGMGVVYLARRKGVEEKLALKVLPPRFAQNQAYIQRFVRESKIAVTIDHPNVVRGIAYGQANGAWYYAMEYVEGKSVRKIIEKNGIVDEKRAIGIISQIAGALDFVGKRGLVHRDIKPTNIIVTSEGVAKLMDLGLAKSIKGEFEELTVEGRALGTPHYMAPEQIKGGKGIDIRADIYALGATLYEMATGRQPFQGASLSEVIGKQLRAELEDPKVHNPELSEGIVRVIEKAMAKRPDDRYLTPGEFKQELLLVLQGKGQEVKPLAPGLSMVLRRNAIGVPAEKAPGARTGSGKRPAPPPPPPIRRRSGSPVLIGVAAAVLLGGSGVAALFLWPKGKPQTTVAPKETPLDLARKQLQAKDWEGALKTAAGLLEEDPTDADAIQVHVAAVAGQRYREEMSRGLKAEGEANWAEAFAAYSEALKHLPGDPNASVAVEAARGKVRSAPESWPEVRKIQAHEGSITALSLIGGKILVSAGTDGKLKAWALAAQGVQDLESGGRVIRAMSSDSKGELLVTGDAEGQVAVQRVSGWQAVVSFKAHSSAINCLDVSPDATHILTGADDHQVLFWQVSSGANRGSLKGHTQGITCVSFSPKGGRVLSAGADGDARVWNEATGHMEKRLFGHMGRIQSARFSPDGGTVATAGDDLLVRIWEPGTGRLLKAMAGHEAPIRCLAFHPEGGRLITGGQDGSVVIWDLALGRQIKSLQADGAAAAVAFDPGGGLFAVGSGDGSVSVYRSPG